MLDQMRRQDAAPDRELPVNSSALQDFFVRKSLFRATFQDTIDSNTFGPLKLVVLQIGIVNHLADFLNRFVSNHEPFRERFKITVAADMRKLDVKHVE